MASVSFGTNYAANILKTLETSSSIGMFARDTGGCLISKVALSRTKDEAKEVSFAEIAESLLFYFSAPILAKNTSKLFSNILKADTELISTPIKELKNNTAIDNSILKNIKLAKFGQIFSTFGVILPLVFAIAPVRNHITLANTGKEKFTSVVGLDKTKDGINKDEENTKTKKLLKKLGFISAGTIAATAGILALAQNKKFFKRIEPAIDKTIQAFDFTKEGDLKLAHYGVLIYPVSIASYFYASRDKYEKAENARRFSITVPLMFFGEKLIEKPLHKGFDKLFKTNIMDESGKIKSYKEIFTLPKDKQKQFLKSKNWAYGLTFFINTMTIAAAVALLNRFETKKNYVKENTIKSLHDRQLKENINQWKMKNIKI